MHDSPQGVVADRVAAVELPDAVQAVVVRGLTLGMAGHRPRGAPETADELTAYQRSLFGPDVIERHLDQVDRLQAVADRTGLPLAQIALAWVTLRVEFTVAIDGT